MGSFDSGFRMGQSAYQQALDNRRQQEQDERQKVLDERAAIEWQQKLEDRTRAKSNEQAQDAAWADARRGLQPISYDGSKADFGAVAPEAAQGPVPQAKMAPVTGAPELGNPLLNNNLRAQGLAIANRDMGQYTALLKEHNKIKTDTEDSDYAMAVQKDPNGPEARAARKFVNQHSKQVSAKVDPKTGITTFAVLEPGEEGYKDHPVSPSDLSKISVGMRRLLRGDVSGLDLISATNKEIGEAVAKEMKLTTDVGGANNTAVKTGADIVDAAERRSEQARKNLEDEATARRNAASQATAAGAAALNARTNAERAKSEIGERDRERKAKDDAIKAINDHMPELEKLTPAQLRGAEGQAVFAKMAMDSARTSGDVSKLIAAVKERVTGGAGRKAVGEVKTTPDGVLVFDEKKNLIEFLTNSGLALPPGINEDRYNTIVREADKAGVTAASVIHPVTGNRIIGYTSATGHDYMTLAEAKADKDNKPQKQTDSGSPKTTPQRGMPPAPAPAPAQPWVDRPGNTLTRDVAPAVNQFAASAQGEYLKGKIARGEPLNPAEQVRAKQYGLVK